jgi:hypothetical protein
MESTLDIASLKDLIRETMREVLQEERILLFKMLMPYVSDEEQAEIDAQFGSPLDEDDDEEWIDMTEWVKNGGQIPETGAEISAKI